MKKPCLLCQNEKRFYKIMSLENMPSSAQNLPDANNLENEHGEKLDLEQCLCCGLVQFRCKPVSYYKDVIRSGGTTTTMKELRMSQYSNFISTFNLNKKKIIEIGSGRGDFLHFLNDFDVQAYGIENNIDLVNYAKNNWGCLNVVQAFADEKCGVIPNGPFDAFLSFNFLEHQPDPNSMMQAIYDNTTDDAVGLITVPSLEYILENNGYYELIKDHIAYYSFETLEFLMNKNGFEVLKKEIVNRDTLSIYVKKRKHISAERMINNRNLLDLSIKALIDSLGQKKIAIWGASHQAFTLAATSKLGKKVSYIIDSAEFKQGKYSPASHIKIVPMEHFYIEPVDVILIVAPGYTEEIYKIIKNKLGNVKIYSLRSSKLEEMA